MIVMNDGRLKWQATTIYPILEDDGEIIGLYGILQNISLRKQVEEGKKKAQFFYNYILDRLPTELVVLNKDGQYIFANHAAIKSKERRGVVIRTEQDAHGDNGNWASAVGSRRNEVMKECLASNKAVIFEEIFPGSDGIERAYIRNLHPFLDANDEVEFLVGYGIDITELKETKETSFKQYQAIECAMDGIALLDKTGRYYYLNASYATILGYKSPREITGKTLNAFYPDHEIERILGYTSEEIIGIDPGAFLQGPETSSETTQEITRSLQDTGIFSGEILNYTKSGAKIWLYLDIAAVNDSAGELVNYVAVENDITLIKLAEHRLQKAMNREQELNRFKTQFVNLASHQFRTPLATIRSSIDLLGLKIEADKQDATFVKFFHKHKSIMTEEIIRMTELMDNILDIGRIDEGKIELFKKKVSLKRFMDEFVKSNSENSGQHRKLKYHFDTPDQIISVDEILLRNILRNVVSNAFKYSAGQKPPELTVRDHGNTYFITIKDYGIGIPKKDQPFLFQSFFRASNAKAFPGSGLGLMIAKKLIVLHGGDIDFESKIGNGCTITIKLHI